MCAGYCRLFWPLLIGCDFSQCTQRCKAVIFKLNFFNILIYLFATGSDCRTMFFTVFNTLVEDLVEVCNNLNQSSCQ